MAYIQFEDPNVLSVLLKNGLGDGSGITYEQAAAYTGDMTFFARTARKITSFNELQYFTGITTIGTQAFNYQTKLSAITFPDSITSIGDQAFWGCKSLENVVLPDGVTSIGTWGFLDCKAFTSLPELSNLQRLGDSAFAGNPISALTIPSTITYLGGNPFSSCPLSSITVDSRNTVFDSRDNCNAIIRTETNQLYSGCKNTVIPITVTSIGSGAFEGINANKLIVPPSVTAINARAFHHFNGTVYFLSETPCTISSYLVFDNCGAIKVPSSALSAYKTATNWSEYADIIVAYEEGEITKTPAPSITPSGRTFTDDLTVMILGEYGSKIYYTLDGTEPTVLSTEYTAQLTITGDTTVKAIAYGNQYDIPSDVVTEVYVQAKTPAPTIIPSGGTFNRSLVVRLICEYGSTIYYTLDGTEPTTASTVYTDYLTLTGDTTVKAIANNSEDYEKPSDVVTGVFIREYTKAPKPIVYPLSANTNSDVVVTITPSGNTSIYYTLDGTEPTSASTEYTTPMTFDSTTTLKAIAYGDYELPSDVETCQYTITAPQKSQKARRASDSNNGLFVKNVTYSGLPVEYRSYILPSSITVTDTEADITWGYQADGTEENLGDYGTKCHVDDSTMLIHVEFTHGDKTYTLEKEIPCKTVVQDAAMNEYSLEMLDAYAVCTLENRLKVKLSARVRHTTEETISIVSDLTNYELGGTCSNGDFTCVKDGSYFSYDGFLTYNYSGSSEPANEITLTLVNNIGTELDKVTIPVTFQAGAIFEVRDDAIRMAVQSSTTYTDNEISGVTNRISQVEINISGITTDVSAITNTVSGITADVSQLQQTASSLTTTVTNLSGEMVTHSEIEQVASAITMNVYGELGKTGINISDGTITLDSNRTVVEGELNIRDGIVFTDDSGNPVTTVDANELGEYKNYNKSQLTPYTVTEKTDNTNTYNGTTGKFPIGTYNGGDVFGFSLAQLCVTFSKNGTGYYEPLSGGTMELQVNFFVDGENSPFFTERYNAELLSNYYWSVQQSGIINATVPSGVSSKNVYAQFAYTSSESPSALGTRQVRVLIKISKDTVTNTHVGKSGIVIGHDTDKVTYIGNDRFVVKKDDSGIGFIGAPNQYGGTQYVPMTFGAASYYYPTGSFPDHPDNFVNSSTARHIWTPKDNYTQVTYASSLGGNWGTMQGFDGLGEKLYVKVFPENTFGILVIDTVTAGGQTGAPSVLLPPRFSVTTTEDGVMCYRQLRPGYTVKVMSMRNDMYVVPNYVDRSIDTQDTYIYNDTTSNILFHFENTSLKHTNYMEFVFMGTNSSGNPIWYAKTR